MRVGLGSTGQKSETLKEKSKKVLFFELVKFALFIGDLDDSDKDLEGHGG